MRIHMIDLFSMPAPASSHNSEAHRLATFQWPRYESLCFNQDRSVRSLPDYYPTYAI